VSTFATPATAIWELGKAEVAVVAALTPTRPCSALITGEGLLVTILTVGETGSITTLDEFFFLGKVQPRFLGATVIHFSAGGEEEEGDF